MISYINLFITEYIEKFEETLKKDDWYLWVNMKSGAVTLPVFQSLEAFWPGIQVTVRVTLVILLSRQSQSYYIHSPFRKPVLVRWQNTIELYLQSMMGEADKGLKTILNYFQVWEQFGATPEFYSLTKLSPTKGREGYPLRPGETPNMYVNSFIKVM